MKDSRCPTACATRLLSVLTASVLLVQCSMPPQQAWRYIQTNGLLTYWSTPRQSPPLRAASSGSQRYVQRSGSSSGLGSGMSSRAYHGAAYPYGYSSNSYFASSATTSGSGRYVPRSKPRTPSQEHAPKVKIPVEEPSSGAHIPHHAPPVSPAPQVSSSAPPANTANEDLPYGTAIPGRINMVNSPYAGKTQLVDVSGMSAGQTVKCPYTGKLFKVPATQQAAANKTESHLESKIEAPKLGDEPKSEDKKP